MSWIFLLPALLLFGSVAVFYPLWLRNGNAALPASGSDERTAQDTKRQMLLRQLKELQYDQAAGLISQQEADALRQPLEKALGIILERPADHTLSEKTQDDSQHYSCPKERFVGFILFLLVIIGAGGLYLKKGTPVDVPPTTAQRSSMSQQSMMDIEKRITGLALRLQKEPNDLEGWLHLARSHAGVGRPAYAYVVLAHVLEKWPDNGDAATYLGERLIQSGDEGLFALGLELFVEINRREPERIQPLIILGSLAFRAGEWDHALRYWNQLLPLIPEDSRAGEALRQSIQNAEKMKLQGSTQVK
ncbi:MAG: c-type cytochrome biogenesis protein CcmI [Magnetococcales bacterium]|nr:c-type cytochrome biogenesis protein CcmI [Magnetococcales bacterium]